MIKIKLMCYGYVAPPLHWKDLWLWLYAAQILSKRMFTFT